MTTLMTQHRNHFETWVSALDGQPVDWHKLMEGQVAAVDWPASAFWAELAEANPDALILLSTRADAATWYRSMKNTILSTRDAQEHIPDFPEVEFEKMFRGLWSRFTDADTDDAEACQRAYDEHLQHVRDTAPADRLLEWDATQGWEPLCEALGVEIPDQPFPLANTTEEFQQMVHNGGLESAQ